MFMRLLFTASFAILALCTPIADAGDDGKCHISEHEQFLFGIGGAIGQLIGDEGNYVEGGFGLRFAYSMESLRLDGHFGGIGGHRKHAISIGVGAAYVPFDGEISPYIGGEVSFMNVFVPDYGATETLSLDLNIGVELARLQFMRFLVEFKCQFPLHSDARSYNWLPQGWLVMMW